VNWPTGREMAVALLLAAALPLAMVGGTPPAAEAVTRTAERPSLAERVLDEANVHADTGMFANMPTKLAQGVYASPAWSTAAGPSFHFCKEESSHCSMRDADSAARPAREGHHGTKSLQHVHRRWHQDGKQQAAGRLSWLAAATVRSDDGIPLSPETSAGRDPVEAGLASTAPACNPHPSTASAPQGVPVAAASSVVHGHTHQSRWPTGQCNARRPAHTTPAGAKAPLAVRVRRDKATCGQGGEQRAADKLGLPAATSVRSDDGIPLSPETSAGQDPVEAGLASTAPACNPHPSTASAPQGVPEAAAARTRRRCTLQGSRSQGRRPTRRLVRSTMADARTPAEAHPRVPDEASGSALLGSAAGALKCSSIVDCWLNSESSEDEVGPPSGPWPWGVRGDARAPA
jgi:hypothetical protein